jgi:hypothetical protein
MALTVTPCSSHCGTETRTSGPARPLAGRVPPITRQRGRHPAAGVAMIRSRREESKTPTDRRDTERLRHRRRRRCPARSVRPRRGVPDQSGCRVSRPLYRLAALLRDVADRRPRRCHARPQPSWPSWAGPHMRPSSSPATLMGEAELVARGYLRCSSVMLAAWATTWSRIGASCWSSSMMAGTSSSRRRSPSGVSWIRMTRPSVSSGIRST